MSVAIEAGIGTLNYGKQSAKGTKATAATTTVGYNRPKWVSGQLAAKKILGSEEYLDGNRFGSPSPFTDRVGGDVGSVVIQAQAENAGLFAAQILGSDTVTGSGDPYTHGLIPHAVPPATGGPYMTVERGFAGTELIDRVQDCVIDQIEIEGEAGRPIMFTLTMQGIKSEAQSSAATVTLEAGNLIPLFYQGTYSLGGATTGAAAQIQKFKFTFSNHHAIVQSESFTPDLLLPTELEARGEFDVVFYDKALYRKVYKNASTSDSYLVGSDALSFTFTMQGSPARQLVIAIGKAEYVTAQPNPALNTEELKQHVVWNAVRPSALTDFLQFAVLNAQSTAY